MILIGVRKMEDRLDVKIASLKERLKVAETQREARQTKKKARMKKRSRADETRRKILLGAAVSEMMRQNLQLGKK
jgi:RNase H-fold protein (predicted Holliday junction resolvase)